MFGLEGAVLFHFLCDERGRFTLAATLALPAMFAAAALLAALEVGQEGVARAEVFSVRVVAVCSGAEALLICAAAFVPPHRLLQESLLQLHVLKGEFADRVEK